MSEKEVYKKCVHNTSETAIFDGYCDLYLNEDNTAGRLVKCKGCPCDDFELEIEDDISSETMQSKLGIDKIP